MAGYTDRRTGQHHEAMMCSSGNCGNPATHLAWLHDDEDDPRGSQFTETKATCENCAAKMVGIADASASTRNPFHVALVPIGDHKVEAAPEAPTGPVNTSGNLRGMHMLERVKMPKDSFEVSDGVVIQRDASSKASRRKYHMAVLRERRSPAQMERSLNKALDDMKAGRTAAREAELRPVLEEAENANQDAMRWARRVNGVEGSGSDVKPVGRPTKWEGGTTANRRKKERRNPEAAAHDAAVIADRSRRMQAQAKKEGRDTSAKTTKGKKRSTKKSK